MKNNEPRPIGAIAVNAAVDRHLVLVELGNQTLALAPEAAHALSLALTNAASVLCPIAAERPKIATTFEQTADPGADLLINTIAVLLDRYRQGTLMPPVPPRIEPDKLKEAKRIGQRSGVIPPDAAADAFEPPRQPAEVNVQGGASLSAPTD